MDDKWNQLTRPLILAVDFDGTLCKNEWPYIGVPHPGVINFVNHCRSKRGWKVILWTSRTDKLLDEALEWCKSQGLIFDAVNDNIPEMIELHGGSNSRKIYADYYLDDHNYCLNPLEVNDIGWHG